MASRNEQVAGVLALFLIFYILTNPENAAVQTKAFVRFTGDSLDSVMSFVEELAEDDDTTSGPSTTTSGVPG